MKTIAYLFGRILIPASLIVTACSQNGEFTLLNGEKRSLDDYKGRWLVVNFWAEWCAPCLEEIPALNRLAQEGAQHDISVIGVSYDALTTQELREVVEKWKFDYAVMDTTPVPVLPFSLPAQLPTNYLINPEGEVVRKLVGKQDFAALSNAIAEAKKSAESQ